MSEIRTRWSGVSSPPARSDAVVTTIGREELHRRLPWEADAPDWAPLVDREWLVTNGLGGYASGTISCHAARCGRRGSTRKTRPRGAPSSVVTMSWPLYACTS